jgi:hypothetical protein
VKAAGKRKGRRGVVGSSGMERLDEAEVIHAPGDTYQRFGMPI